MAEVSGLRWRAVSRVIGWKIEMDVAIEGDGMGVA
jgi:hypothetical protein